MILLTNRYLRDTIRIHVETWNAYIVVWMKYISILLFFLGCNYSTVDEISGQYVMNGQEVFNLYVIKGDGSFEQYHSSSKLMSKTTGVYTIDGNTITLKSKEVTTSFDVREIDEEAKLSYDVKNRRLVFSELNDLLYLEKADSWLKH